MFNNFSQQLVHRLVKTGASAYHTMCANVQKTTEANNASSMLTYALQRKSISMEPTIVRVTMMHFDVSSRAQMVWNFQVHQHLNTFVNMKKGIFCHHQLLNATIVSETFIVDRKIQQQNCQSSNLFITHCCKSSLGADMEIIHGKELSHSSSTVNRTTIVGESSGGKRKVKKIRKKGHKSYDTDDEDDESYEKIITKTKIVVKKGRKTKKPKGYDSGEYEYVEYDDENDAIDGMSAIGVQSLYISNGLTVKHRIPKPATCTTWNGNKIKTFDGLIFTPNLYCSHTLVKDQIDGTFGIFLIACPSNREQPCPHALEIVLSNNKYLLESSSQYNQ